MLSQGRIQFSTSPGEMEDTCTELLRKKVAVLGWDIEWRTTYQTGEPPRKTALMQLCYQLPRGHFCCHLFHVYSCGLPPSLKTLLSDPVRPIVMPQVASSTVHIRLAELKMTYVVLSKMRSYEQKLVDI